MNQVRAERLKKELLDKKRAMWGELRDEVFRKLGAEYSGQFDIPNDIEDLSVIDLIEELGLSVADIRKKEITGIEEALARLEAGEYGLCTGCGGQIDEKRLAVEPGATLCVSCQGALEKEKGRKPTL